MSDPWSELLSSRYGNATDDVRTSAWATVKQTLHLGESVDGEVVAVAPFGAWIDVGFSIPGLLLITRFYPSLKPVGIGNMPQRGDSVRSRLISFNEKDKTLVLSQDLNEEVF